MTTYPTAPLRLPHGDSGWGNTAFKRSAPLTTVRIPKKTAKEAEYTRDRLLGYLEEARAIAIDKDNSAAVTSATVAMARILGLIIDRREVGDVGAFDNMTDEELMSAAARKARELGIGGPRLVEDHN